MFINNGPYHYDIGPKCQIAGVLVTTVQALVQLLLVTSCFFADMMAMYWFDDAILQAVTASFFANIVRPKKELLLALALVALGIESFVAHGRFGVYWFALIPCYLAVYFLMHRLTLSRSVPYLLFTLTLLVNWLIIDPYLIGCRPSFSYTMLKVFGNMAVLFVLI
jgi:hypothetical protein